MKTTAILLVEVTAINGEEYRTWGPQLYPSGDTPPAPLPTNKTVWVDFKYIYARWLQLHPGRERFSFRISESGEIEELTPRPLEGW